MSPLKLIPFSFKHIPPLNQPMLHLSSLFHRSATRSDFYRARRKKFSIKISDWLLCSYVEGWRYIWEPFSHEIIMIWIFCRVCLCFVQNVSAVFRLQTPDPQSNNLSDSAFWVKSFTRLRIVYCLPKKNLFYTRTCIVGTRIKLHCTFMASFTLNPRSLHEEVSAGIKLIVLPFSPPFSTEFFFIRNFMFRSFWECRGVWAKKKDREMELNSNEKNICLLNDYFMKLKRVRKEKWEENYFWRAQRGKLREHDGAFEEA